MSRSIRVTFGSEFAFDFVRLVIEGRVRSFVYVGHTSSLRVFGFVCVFARTLIVPLRAGGDAHFFVFALTKSVNCGFV